MPDLEKAQPAMTSLSRIYNGPKNPMDAQIHDNNCFLRCLYNIPQGTMMLVLPGTVILLMGLIVLPWTYIEEGWSDGTQQAGVIFVVFGGILFFSGLTYGCYYYYKYKPKIPSRHAISPQRAKQPVALVGIYKIRQDGMIVPSDSISNTPAAATIS